MTTLIIRLKIAIYTIARFPQQSLQLFFAGLTSFVLGLTALWFNQVQDNWLAPTGVILITLGVLCSAFGWLGMLAHRLAQIINRAEQARRKTGDS